LYFFYVVVKSIGAYRMLCRKNENSCLIIADNATVKKMIFKVKI